MAAELDALRAATRPGAANRAWPPSGSETKGSSGPPSIPLLITRRDPNGPERLGGWADAGTFGHSAESGADGEEDVAALRAQLEEAQRSLAAAGSTAAETDGRIAALEAKAAEAE
eukprot:383243-Prorocentrum_minimum.AAC.1